MSPKIFVITLLLFVIISFHPSLPGGECQSHTVMVLLYHHFVEGEPITPWELNREDFALQMKYLKEEGYRTLSLEEFYSFYQQREFPPKSVLLTFDDAYHSFYTIAYPILLEYGLQGVVYPIVEFIPGLQREGSYSQYLSFSEMRELQESGLVEFGSHTYGLHHFREDETPFIEPYENETEEEYRKRILVDLRLSRDLLSLQLDREISSLAWPYGMKTPIAEEIALEVGYEILLCGEPGLVTRNTPLTCIPRYSITSGSLEDFIRLLRRL